MRRLPSLAALRTFECAARHAHFGRAAAELCVTDSAVSHQIRQLEEQLGVSLFIREGRQIRPTMAAGRLMQSLQQAFELIGDACDELRDPSSLAVLRLAVTAELAQKWLMSRLTDFYARYPHITLHLYEQPIDATAPGEDIDLAITYGTGPVDSSAYFVRPLPALQFFPVCSPGLFNQGTLKAPGIWPVTACSTTIRTARPGPPGSPATPAISAPNGSCISPMPDWRLRLRPRGRAWPWAIT